MSGDTFDDLPPKLQEAAEFILKNIKDGPRILCMAELLHAHAIYQKAVMLNECCDDDCEEFGVVVRPDGNVLCPKHEAEWPWCSSPGCRNKSYKRKKDGFCHPHKAVEDLKGMLIVDPETKISMPLDEYLIWKEGR